MILVDAVAIEQSWRAIALHDETVRNVKASRIQCDEIWSFRHAKAKNVATAKAAPVLHDTRAHDRRR